MDTENENEADPDLCIDCGKVAIMYECDACGAALCGQCYEAGGGWCSDCIADEEANQIDD